MNRGWWVLVGGMILVLMWRWSGWREEAKKYCDGCEVRERIRWWREVQDREWGWSITINGVRWNCAKWEEVCKDWEEVRSGEEVVLKGRGRVVEVEGKKAGIAVEVEAMSRLRRERSWEQFGWEVYEGLRELRERVVVIYEQVLSRKEAGLVAGMVLGERSVIDEELEDKLVNTGTVHVVAASGFNITVVARVILVGLVAFVRRKKAVFLAILGVWAYVLIAGGNPPVIRAGIMGTLILVAQGLGREYWVGWGFGVTMWLMLMIAPWWIGDVSFQLSIAATAGILWGVRSLEDWWSKMTKRWRKSESGREREISMARMMGVVQGDLTTTLAATMATMPLTLVRFERVSLVSPLVNTLVLWLVPPIMALGGLVAGVGLVSVDLARMLAIFLQPLVGLFVGIVEWFAEVPGISVEVRGANWWLGGGWWLVMTGWWMRRKRRVKS